MGASEAVLYKGCNGWSLYPSWVQDDPTEAVIPLGGIRHFVAMDDKKMVVAAKQTLQDTVRLLLTRVYLGWPASASIFPSIVQTCWTFASLDIALSMSDSSLSFPTAMSRPCQATSRWVFWQIMCQQLGCHTLGFWYLMLSVCKDPQLVYLWISVVHKLQTWVYCLMDMWEPWTGWPIRFGPSLTPALSKIHRCGDRASKGIVASRCPNPTIVASEQAMWTQKRSQPQVYHLHFLGSLSCNQVMMRTLIQSWFDACFHPGWQHLWRKALH